VTSPAPQSSARTLFLEYWRAFATHAGGRLWLAVGLLVFVGLLEGSGLLMLLPLLHAFGLGDSSRTPGLPGMLARGLGVAGATLPTVLVVFVLIKTAQAGLRALSGILNLRIETDFICFLRERFYRSMMQASWLFLSRQRSSELSQALLVELPQVGFATRQLLTLLSVGVLAAVQVFIALTLSPLMTAMALTSDAVVALGLRKLRRRSHALGELGYGKRAEMAAAVSEHLAGMKIAKSHGRESQHFTHFQRAMNEIAAHTLQLQRLGALTGIWLEVGAVVAMSLFVLLAAARVDSARLLVLMFVFTRLLSQSTLLQNLWHSIVHGLPAFAATDRLRARMLAAAEPPAAPGETALELRQEIRLEAVHFRYDPALPAAALRGIDLAIPARSVIALCGPSGAGKSTLADVVLGLLAPTGGRVLLDGQHLEGPRLHAWRKSIGYVPQETFLFHDSVRANLAWAQPGADDATLRVALRAAAAEAFVDRLPQGLDTVIGDRGVRLSGGERQRLALARALLRRPTLLVLDEATSALDMQNERLVQQAVERLHGELTILVIAHRLSTVRFADRIVVLENGAVAETGTWQELCARSEGAFQRLVALDTRVA
jgi:ATP-binding cassette subfamily C protein